MKEKILVALKTKYKTFGFSEKAFDGVADYLSKTVTEESQIETAIDGVEGLFKGFQGDVDYVRNEKSGLQKQLDELKKKIENPNPQPKPEEEKKDDVPAWAQAIIDSNKTLSEKLAGYEQERVQAQRNAQVSAKAKEYGIPETLVPMLNIPSDADLDTFMKDAKQTFVNAGLQSVPPGSGDPKPTDDIDSIVAIIDKGTKEIVEQAKN
ncbi:hypothetical protein [Paraprevotella clara]|jgi:hypothetical protein|uniref:hypothetical protein n=1 Tax=Paraprevotella clara TaxID=454154 RepID=UPI0020697CA0|nr:hypothetical protein [Paraprevotella clara]DAJ72445.1 MAG TPA: hypothetical protein [Caudoviricetes sp.]